MSDQRISVFKQPKPFYVVFFIEFWERFGFYGMQVILTFYFVKQLGLTEAQSYNLYSAFTALLYALTCVGGYIGDHLLGTKRTMIMGALFLALGYFLLGFSATHFNTLPWLHQWFQELGFGRGLFIALGVIAVGNGLFKANPSSLLSKCYKQNDPRLDGAFTMYYMAINIGALVSMVLVPVVAAKYGWAMGFWVACLGLILGVINYFLLYGWVKNVSSKAGKNPFCILKFGLVVCFAFIGAGIASIILKHLTVAHYLLTTIGILVAGIFIYQITKSKGSERSKMIVALILMLQAIAFFVLYQQMPTSLNFFAINNVHHALLGFYIDPKSFQALNPFWIMLASPILAYLYGKLGKHGKDLTMPAKFTLGMFLCSMGFISLYVSTFFANHHGIVSAWWLVCSYGFQSVGELLVSGLGLAMVARLVPQRMMGFIMGAWFMVTAVAMVLGGFVASLTSVPSHLQDKFTSLHVYGHVFLGIGLVTFLVMLIMWVMVPFLKRRIA